MFVSNHNLLAYQFLESFDLHTSPPVSLLIGAEGCGKTFFSKNIFKKVENEAVNPIFIDALKFSTKYAFAASNGELSIFRKYFRSSKFLVIDNINLLQGKTKTIEELFHTIETVLTQGGKILISYRGNDLNLDYLGKRFASRLHSGFIIRIQQPTTQEIAHFKDYYLKNLAEINLLETVELSKAVNLREVIRVIDRVLKRASADEVEPKETTVIRLKKDFRKVLPVVAQYYVVDSEEVVGNSKKVNHVQARYMLYLIIHERYNYTYSEISYSVKKNVRDLERKCEKLKEENRDLFETLCQKLYN